MASPELGLRYSHFQQRRARQIYSFLLDLQKASNTQLGLSPRLELLVLDSKDWHKLSQSIYGIPFIKGRKALVQLFIPADYPGRFKHKLDEVFLEAALKLPGEVSELFNLLIGFDWARAYLKLISKQKLSPQDQLTLTTQLYILALERSGWDGILERLNLWFNHPYQDVPEASTVVTQPKSQKALIDRYLVFGQSFSLEKNRKPKWETLDLI
jgi:hypothetical protein